MKIKLNSTSIKFFILTIVLMGSSLLVHGVVYAADGDDCQPIPGNHALSLVPTWYQYLPGRVSEIKNSNGQPSTTRCVPTFPTQVVIVNGAPQKQPVLSKGIALVAMAFVDILTRVAGLIAIGLIIYGSFQYVASQGEPNNLSNAKSTITNAIIGLVIVVLAIGLIQFVAKAVG